MRQIILVCGYPRSGNTWLSRLLGDALNSPVQGLPGQERGSLAAEGLSRPGNYRIIQAHMIPTNWHDFTAEEVGNKKVVSIIRHPFDVAVSASYFWDIDFLLVLDLMHSGHWPFNGFPSWPSYYKTIHRYTDIITSYELLSLNTQAALEVILEKLDCVVSKYRVGKVVDRQSFNKKRQSVQNHPERHSYDLDAQLHSLRRGEMNKWREYSQGVDMKNRIGLEFQRTMKEYGYDWQ